MRLNRIFIVTGLILFLVLGSSLMAQKGRASRQGSRAYATENRPLAFPLFQDENGDGICDQFQDHDGDGIPNSQDPDWERPEDGSGKQYGRDADREPGRFAHRNEFQENGGDGQHKRSFRYTWNRAGGPAGNSPGPNGGGQRRGGK